MRLRTRTTAPLTAIPDEAFDKIMANNVKSVLWLAAMTLPLMAERAQKEKSSGSFILVGSIGGLLANTVIGAYGLSKAAGHHLVRNLAAEWGPKNVRVNAIAPGLVKTEFARALWEDDKRRAERIAATPLRRLGEPRDIGGIAVFLSSDASAFITGQCIVADGGVTIL
jgi:NAD(P)-dependent dehydrogenase (short-subunit alcohol dehydrogenase family)